MTSKHVTNYVKCWSQTSNLHTDSNKLIP